jgi:hypothetical protein
MHLCTDEMLLLSAAVRAGMAVMQCWVCMRIMLVERFIGPRTKPTPRDEGYDWFSWHPDYVNEVGQVVHFDEPGGG